MRMMRAAVPVFIRQGRGVFVTIASVGGLFGARAGTAYTASMHGAIGLARNVGYMYAKKGIRSNIIAPGEVRTEIGTGIQFNPEGAATCATGLDINPRTGEPEEIAKVALFLALDDSSFVNGATIVADEGWLVRTIAACTGRPRSRAPNPGCPAMDAPVRSWPPGMYRRLPTRRIVQCIVDSRIQGAQA